MKDINNRKFKFFGNTVFVILLVLLVSGCSNQQKKNANVPVKIEKPPITPKWAFGHIVWEDSINTQTAATGLVSQYKSHQIPVSGVIIDSPWSLSYNDFRWDTAKYPEPSKMIKEFEKEHVRVILWLTGCINVKSYDVPVDTSPDFDYVIAHNYAVNNGKISKWWKGEGVHLDFTNPKAVQWWNSKLDEVFVDGVSGWKVDQGEYYFADSLSMLYSKAGQDGMNFGDTVTTSKGRIPMSDFKKAYYDSMFDYVQKHRQEGITLARPFSHQGDFAARISKVSLGWSGDFKGSYEGLKLQLNNIYTSAKAGYGALACEVGGFYEDRSTKSQLLRYAQFGAMTACMINGGQNGAFTNHLPWYHDKETTDIYRYYVILHKELSPYMFSTVVDAHLNGGSLLKDVDFNQESHKVGNSIFFKAITSDTNLVSFFLPEEGNWIDFWTNEKYEGGSKVIKNYALKQAPIFVQEGAVIPLEIDNDITGFGDNSFKGKTVVLIYPGKASHYTFHKPTGDGVQYEDIEISYSNDVLNVSSPKEHSFLFLIKSRVEPEQIEGSDSWKYNKKREQTELLKTGKNFSIKILQ